MGYSPRGHKELDTTEATKQPPLPSSAGSSMSPALSRTEMIAGHRGNEFIKEM